MRMKAVIRLVVVRINDFHTDDEAFEEKVARLSILETLRCFIVIKA